MKNGRSFRTQKKSDIIQYPTPQASCSMPEWYSAFVGNIKALVIESRRQVIWTANQQMIMMYYRIGKSILQQQESEGWGTRVIDRLSADLKSEYPELQGFSPRNLKYMRRFAEIWSDETIVQRTVAQLPWRHNISLMEKVKEPNRRIVYAMAAIRHGWSKAILDMNIETYTIERSGKLPENFTKSLPDADSDMIKYMFKDPYLLDFTGADAQSREKDIEEGLTTHITRFNSWIFA